MILIMVVLILKFMSRNHHATVECLSAEDAADRNAEAHRRAFLNNFYKNQIEFFDAHAKSCCDMVIVTGSNSHIGKSVDGVYYRYNIIIIYEILFRNI